MASRARAFNLSGGSSGGGALPWWKVWLNVSLLQFASKDLEALYEQYLAGSTNPWTLVFSAHVLMGWAMFGQKLLVTPSELRAYLPAAWPIGVFLPAMMACLLAIIFLKPVFYAQHRRALHTGVLCGILPTIGIAQAVLLWMRLANRAARAGGPPSWMQQLQSFTTENFYFTIMWVGVLAFPVGQATGIAIATAILLADMAKNSHLCGLPLWGEGAVTLSPRVLAWTKTASFWLVKFGEPDLGLRGGSLSLPCPAVLAFWQMVGWWMACHAVFAADIVRRRAFLRTHAALVHLGPAHQAAAMSWPFGRATSVIRLASTSIALSYFASALWSIALLAFQ